MMKSIAISTKLAGLLILLCSILVPSALPAAPDLDSKQINMAIEKPMKLTEVASTLALLSGTVFALDFEGDVVIAPASWENESLRTVLDELLHPYDMQWRVEGNGIRISRAEGSQPERGPAAGATQSDGHSSTDAPPFQLALQTKDFRLPHPGELEIIEVLLYGQSGKRSANAMGRTCEFDESTNRVTITDTAARLFEVKAYLAGRWMGVTSDPEKLPFAMMANRPVSLDDYIKGVSLASNLNVLVEQGVDVTFNPFKLYDLSLKQFLDQTLQPAGLKWRIQNGTLFIYSSAEPPFSNPGKEFLAMKAVRFRLGGEGDFNTKCLEVTRRLYADGGQAKANRQGRKYWANEQTQTVVIVDDLRRIQDVAELVQSQN